MAFYSFNHHFAQKWVSLYLSPQASGKWCRPPLPIILWDVVSYSFSSDAADTVLCNITPDAPLPLKSMHHLPLTPRAWDNQLARLKFDDGETNRIMLTCGLVHAWIHMMFLSVIVFSQCVPLVSTHSPSMVDKAWDAETGPMWRSS